MRHQSDECGVPMKNLLVGCGADEVQLFAHT